MNENINLNGKTIVPRLRNRRWNGVGFALWAEMFPLENMTAPPGEKIPDVPIVAFGIDQESTIAFPDKKVFKESGLTPDEIQKKAMQFLESQNPVWEEVDMGADDDGKILVYSHEYASEQLLNKKFLKQAADRFDSPFIFVTAMTQSTCFAMGFTQDQKKIFDFISYSLFRYISNPGNRIAPTVCLATNDGKLVGVVGYSKELYDSVSRFVEEKHPDDSNVEVEFLNKPNGEEFVKIFAYGSNPEKLLENIWETIIESTNSLKSRWKDVQTNGHDIDVQVVFIIDKMPPMERFDDDIETMNQRLINSNRDMLGLGATTSIGVEFFYKHSSQLK